MKIEVRQEHIDKGCKNAGSACPVYYALRDAGLPATCVGHSSFILPLRDGTEAFCVLLPLDTSLRIMEYDRKGTMTPFTFELDLDHVVYPK